MDIAEVYALAEATAEQLGIRITDTKRIRRNLKPDVGVTTILWNEDWMMWIDRHYISYSRLTALTVVYVMTDRKHITEEIPNLRHMLDVEKEYDHMQILLNIKRQLEHALSAMKQSGERSFIAEIPSTPQSHIRRERSEQAGRFVLTLCGKCRSHFENTEAYKLRRLDYEQEIKESCSYCTKGRGFDYEITPKRRKERI